MLNDTKVIPARLIGEREETGGKVEVLLLKRGEDNVWETLVKPGKKGQTWYQACLWWRPVTGRSC